MGPQASDSTASALAQKGLSHREGEVLFWVSQGKSNQEVGIILHISHRTVSKHLERIYIKLGVESRTAAVLQSLDIIHETDREAQMNSDFESKCILLVDDDSNVRGFLRTLLESEGYFCKEVENGALALDWLKTNRTDLVITDNKMPILGGLDFLERLSSMNIGFHPKIIVHSGNLTEEITKRALNIGAYAVLSKPCKVSELLTTIVQSLKSASPSTRRLFIE